MTLSALTESERTVVKLTLEATFEFFDFDFHVRLGVTAEEMKELLKNWPNINDGDKTVGALAINNSLNNLLHGEGIDDDTALKLMGVNRSEMLRIYRKWAGNRGGSSTGFK